MNLGWKLAAEVNGTAAPWLLDSYEHERRPVGEQVVKNSCAQEVLAAATTPDQMAVRELLAEMLAEHPEANRTLAERVSGPAIAYPAEEGAHPLAGHRAPDLELDVSSGPARLFEWWRDGQFALVARRPFPTCSRANHVAVNRATGPRATSPTGAKPTRRWYAPTGTSPGSDRPQAPPPRGATGDNLSK